MLAWSCAAADGAGPLTINPPALVGLTVSPKTSVVGVNTTLKLEAVGRREDGSAAHVLPTWSASGGRVDGDGRFHSATTGSFQVIAADSVFADTAQIQVVRPGPPPDTTTCAGRGGPTLTEAGTHSSRFDERTGVPAGAVVDARGADWPQVADYAVLVGGGDGWCWTGGRVEGFWSDQTTWLGMHGRTAFEDYGAAHTVLEALYLRNYGDGLTIRMTADDWTLRHSHFVHMRDDCIENDYERSGLVDDVLFEGCYSGLSSRPSDYQVGTYSGANNRWTIQNSLLWLEPMAQPFKGTPPNTSGFFKWDKSSYNTSPQLALRNNVFRADMTPADGTLCLAPRGKVVESVNNVIVWLGAGTYPCLPLPPGWTLTTDRSVWDDAVSAWKAAHSGL
ncbi:MAG TPA: hypothetical protein VJQ46_10485 [Gemmatimonadales bacterium]|nr:hypothetical protein [Gemmatimonadales bacterium]